MIFAKFIWTNRGMRRMFAEIASANPDQKIAEVSFSRGLLRWLVIIKTEAKSAD